MCKCQVPRDSSSYSLTLRTHECNSPITSTYPASAYVGIDQSITYGSSGTTILSSTAGITDTGTTLILLASGQSLPLISAVIGVTDGLMNREQMLSHGTRGRPVPSWTTTPAC